MKIWDIGVNLFYYKTGEDSKMEIKDYDEQIDKLVKNSLYEKAGKFEATDGLKERIDHKINEKEEKVKRCLN